MTGILLDVATVALGVGGLTVLPRWWHGWFDKRETKFLGKQRSHEEMAFWWLPLNEPIRRGLIRSVGVSVFTYWSGILTAGTQAVSRNFAGETIGKTFSVLMVIFALTAVAGLLFAVAVICFNRPKWIVPPSARLEPGIFTRRRGRGRG
jgi:hypothetical protein